MGGGSYYQASRAGGNGKSNKWDCGPTAPSITVSFMLREQDPRTIADDRGYLGACAIACLRRLRHEVDDGAGPGKLSAHLHRHLDHAFVRQEVGGQRLAGHRRRQHRALLQGDGGASPNDLAVGQPGAWQSGDGQLAAGQVSVLEDLTGHHLACGHDDLRDLTRARAQERERDQRGGPDAQTDHEVAPAPQEDGGDRSWCALQGAVTEWSHRSRVE